MNQYPLWKNLLILGVVLAGLILALPNVFSQDPSIEISANRGSEVTAASADEVRAALEKAGVPFKRVDAPRDGKLLVRFPASADQLRGQEAIEAAMGERYRTALNLSVDLPGWVRALGLKPMNLGLDLRGGIHVVIDVDMDAALDQALERYVEDIRTLLRDAKVRYLSISREQGAVQIRFADSAARDAGQKAVGKQLGEAPAYDRREGGRVSADCGPAPRRAEADKRPGAPTEHHHIAE